MNRKELMSMAKRANQRLRQLEKKGMTNSSNAYKHIEMNAQVSDDIYKRTRHGDIKFSTNYTQLVKDGVLEQYTEELTKFLDAKTSTPTGINNKYRKQYETFKEKHHVNDLSFDDYIRDVNNFTSKEYFKNLSSSLKTLLFSKKFSDNDIAIVDSIFEEMEMEKNDSLANIKELELYKMLSSDTYSQKLKDYERKRRKREEKQQKKKEKKKEKKKKNKKGKKKGKKKR